MPEKPAKHCIARDKMLPSGGKGLSKLIRKQNKYLTEEAKNPYGRHQPTTSKKKEEKKQQQNNSKTTKSAQNINS
jgi:hypothetical protein